MPLLKRKLQTEAEEQRMIRSRVENTPFQATEDEAEQVRLISERIAAEFRDEIATVGFTEEVKQRVRQSIARNADELNLDYETQKRIESLAISNITGLGPIEPYMKDASVSEIIVQRYDNICIERNGLVKREDTAFLSEAHLRNVIGRIVQPVGRQINLYTPMVDARLSDGSRVNATIPPVTPDGATLTIRKFPQNTMTGEDYIAIRSISRDMLDFLAACVQGKINMIVSGGTSTGKTTLLNMLSMYLPPDELIITIEDSCELRLMQSNVRRMEARAVNTEGMMPITIQTLVRNALRMRPDRLIVGEIRDGTVVEMMSAMSTGHPGSLSTVHANSPQNLINARFPILYSMNRTAAFSEEAQRLQIAEALQIIVHVDRLETGERKITGITHVAGLSESKEILLKDIFRYNKKKADFEPTGYVPKEIIRQIRGMGITVDEAIFHRKEEM